MLKQPNLGYADVKLNLHPCILLAGDAHSLYVCILWSLCSWPIGRAVWPQLDLYCKGHRIMVPSRSTIRGPKKVSASFYCIGAANFFIRHQTDRLKNLALKNLNIFCDEEPPKTFEGNKKLHVLKWVEIDASQSGNFFSSRRLEISSWGIPFLCCNIGVAFPTI